MERKITTFTVECGAPEIAQLKELLQERGWDFSAVPYAHWRAAGEKVNVVAYLSGKVTVQGANTGDFVEFTLEPEILRRVVTMPIAPENELDATPHGGIDESGKGDFFGPLVIAGVCVDEESAPRLAELGVCDSKKIKSDAKIKKLAAGIRAIVRGKYSVVAIGVSTYNELYVKMGNLNRLLAWGHARVIENLLEKTPDCPRMLSDKFADERLIERALLQRGRGIKMEQRTKGESDIAVAAASILARERFVVCMDDLGVELGMELPKGVSGGVKATARRILAEHGEEALRRCAKSHFRTFGEITGTPEAD